MQCYGPEGVGRLYQVNVLLTTLGFWKLYKHSSSRISGVCNILAGGRLASLKREPRYTHSVEQTRGTSRGCRKKSRGKMTTWRKTGYTSRGYRKKTRYTSRGHRKKTGYTSSGYKKKTGYTSRGYRKKSRGKMTAWRKTGYTSRGYRMNSRGKKNGLEDNTRNNCEKRMKSFRKHWRNHLELQMNRYC